MPLLSNLETPVIIELVRLWCSMSVDGALPVKHDIDPVDLARTGAMPIVWLVECSDDRIVFRLAGEDIVRLIGRPVRGREVSEFYDPATYEVLKQERSRVLDALETGHEKGIIVSGQEGRRYQGERVFLPMADKEGNARFILGATCNTELHDMYPAEETAQKFSTEPTVFTPYREVLASFSPEQ